MQGSRLGTIVAWIAVVALEVEICGFIVDTLWKQDQQLGGGWTLGVRQRTKTRMYGADKAIRKQLSVVFPSLSEFTMYLFLFFTVLGEVVSLLYFFFF